MKKKAALLLISIFIGMFGIVATIQGLSPSVLFAEENRPASTYSGGSVCFATIDGNTVYESADASAVQTAVDAATSGDTIKLAGTCAGLQGVSSAFEVIRIEISLTLQGGYTPTNWTTPNPDTTPTILDAQKIGRVIHAYGGVGNDITVVVDGITIINGDTDEGGGLRMLGESFTIQNSRFISNSANFGGAIYVRGDVVLRDSYFEGNTAANNGGAVEGKGNILISNVEFNNNSSEIAGGAVAITSNFLGDFVTISDTVFINNNALGGGGGVRFANSDTIFSIINSSFHENSAANGGGVSNFNTTIFITNTSFTNNSASNGGAINNDGWLTVTNNTIHQNSSVIGGGIYNQGEEITIRNSTISNNTATQSGFSGSGIYNGSGGMLFMTNTIVADNEGADNCYSAVSSNLHDNGFNLVEDGSCDFPVSGDPQLGALFEYAESKFIQTLAPTSMAIDAGDCSNGTLNFDQAGVTRPIDGDGDGDAQCDIGAYEHQLYEFEIWLPVAIR